MPAIRSRSAPRASSRSRIPKAIGSRPPPTRPASVSVPRSTMKIGCRRSMMPLRRRREAFPSRSTAWPAGRRRRRHRRRAFRQAAEIEQETLQRLAGGRRPAHPHLLPAGGGLPGRAVRARVSEDLLAAFRAARGRASSRGGPPCRPSRRPGQCRCRIGRASGSTCRSAPWGRLAGRVPAAAPTRSTS